MIRPFLLCTMEGRINLVKRNTEMTLSLWINSSSSTENFKYSWKGFSVLVMLLVLVMKIMMIDGLYDQDSIKPISLTNTTTSIVHQHRNVFVLKFLCNMIIRFFVKVSLDDMSFDLIFGFNIMSKLL